MKDDSYTNEQVVKTFLDFYTFLKSIEYTLEDENDIKQLQEDTQLINSYIEFYLSQRFSDEELDHAYKAIYDKYLNKTMS